MNQEKGFLLKKLDLNDLSFHSTIETYFKGYILRPLSMPGQ